jgi:hypothetical protein
MLGSTQKSYQSGKCQLLRRLEKTKKKLIIKELWSSEEQSPHFSTDRLCWITIHLLPHTHRETESERVRWGIRIIKAKAKANQWLTFIFYCMQLLPAS